MLAFKFECFPIFFTDLFFQRRSIKSENGHDHPALLTYVYRGNWSKTLLRKIRQNSLYKCIFRNIDNVTIDFIFKNYINDFCYQEKRITFIEI